MKKRVYVAGPLNGMACDYLRNVKSMIQVGVQIHAAGYAVFIPALDLLAGIVHGGWDYEDYFANSFAWIRVSEAMFLCPGWRNSPGTAREIEEAKRCGIPIVDSLDGLKEVFGDE